jgi:peroxiredoxin
VRPNTGRRLTALLLAVSVWGAAGADQPTVPALAKGFDLVTYRAGTRPPHFSGATFDARQLSLTDLRGKVVVINFWASWCVECRQEIPAMERLHRELALRGFTIVGINVKEDRLTVGRYAAEMGLTFPLVLDPDGRTRHSYGVVGIPTTFVVGRDGRAVAFGVGPRNWESPPARALIEALLAETAAGAP